MRFILLMLVALLVLVVIFAVQNPGAVDVEFLSFQGEISLLLVTLAAFGLGVIAGVVGMLPYYVRSRRRLGRTKKELKRDQKAHEEASTAPSPASAAARAEKSRKGGEPVQEPPPPPEPGPPAEPTPPAAPKRGREYGEP